jgi:hypothetical protein
MNSQMPPQSSSYVVQNNMQTSASQMWPMNSQVQPSSSFVAGNSMQPTQVWPMNSQMLQQSSSYVVPNNMQTSASQMWREFIGHICDAEVCMLFCTTELLDCGSICEKTTCKPQHLKCGQ